MCDRVALAHPKRIAAAAACFLRADCSAQYNTRCSSTCRTVKRCGIATSRTELTIGLLLIEAPPAALLLLQVTVPGLTGVSSTAVRAAIARGDWAEAEQSLRPEVLGYIRQHSLYV